MTILSAGRQSLGRRFIMKHYSILTPVTCSVQFISTITFPECDIQEAATVRRYYMTNNRDIICRHTLNVVVVHSLLWRCNCWRWCFGLSTNTYRVCSDEHREPGLYRTRPVASASPPLSLFQCDNDSISRLRSTLCYCTVSQSVRPL